MRLTSTNNENSYWIPGKSEPHYPKLSHDIEADVAIVGGGIAGLTIAYALNKSGFAVAVVEKNTIASGTTGGTTGKVTAQHGLIYNYLIKQFGEKKAKTYANAFMAAIIDIEKLIAYEKINCDWAREDNFVYTTNPKKIAKLEKEAEAAARLGLPASFEPTTSLTFPTVGAVKFANQARFNAAKYTQHLARILDKNGCKIYENSNIERIEDNEPTKIASPEGSVTAQHIVVATKVPTSPLFARLGYALLEYPETAYVVAGKTSMKLEGMYISPDKGHYSIMPVKHGPHTYVLIGGESHIPGLGRPTDHYDKLAMYAKQWFDVEEIEYRWKAMDYIAYDHLPLIGKMYPWSKNLYAVSGFKKWGLATSMVAARVIRDAIRGKDSDEARLFYPHRKSAPLKIPRTAFELLKG